MVKLTVNEQELLYKFFDISDGYVLMLLYRMTDKNKTWTKKIIFEATGINIYEDPEYSSLSQQKAIEKVMETQPATNVSTMFRGFYDFVMLNQEEYKKAYSSWCSDIVFDKLANNVDKLLIKLKSTPTISSTLPMFDAKGIRDLEKDLKQKIENEEFALAIDRLHTYALFYLEKLCKDNNLTPNTDPNNHIMFDDMISQLQNKFNNNNLLSEFDKQTIKNSKIMLQKFNSVRNNESFAHPNKVIENAKAKYVVENIIALLNYVGEISKESNKIDKYCQCKDRSGYKTIKGDSILCWRQCNDCKKIIEGSEFEDLPF